MHDAVYGVVHDATGPRTPWVETIQSWSACHEIVNGAMCHVVMKGAVKQCLVQR